MATAGARYTTVSSDKWADDWYLEVLKDPRQKILFDFLCEGNHGTYAGVFKLDPRVARYVTGPWRTQKFTETLEVQFAGHVFRFPGNWWFVRTYLKWNGAKDGVLTEPQAKGVVAIVKESPTDCAVLFWNVYKNLLEPHSHTPESLGISTGTPLDITIPYHPIPGHSIPISSRRSAPDPSVRELQEYYLGKWNTHIDADMTQMFPWAAAGAHFKKALKVSKGDIEPIKKTIDTFFRDWVHEKGGADFSHYRAKFAAQVKAVQEGR